MPIERLSPEGGSAPRGDYSMISVTDRGSRIAFLSGQTGRREDGTISSETAEQIADAFTNVGNLLKAVDSDPFGIIHLRTHLVGRDPLATFTAVRRTVYRDWFGGEAPPTNTLLIVSGLADPDAEVEIEAVVEVGRTGVADAFDNDRDGK